jgi:hypothetical protein
MSGGGRCIKGTRGILGIAAYKFCRRHTVARADGGNAQKVIDGGANAGRKIGCNKDERGVIWVPIVSADSSSAAAVSSVCCRANAGYTIYRGNKPLPRRISRWGSYRRAGRGRGP